MASDVFDVVLNPTDHLFQGVGFAAPPVDLREASDTWTHFVAQHVLQYLRAEQVVVSDRVRPRSHDGHVTHQHIEKLWQLIQ